jgi:hypothetical protein
LRILSISSGGAALSVLFAVGPVAIGHHAGDQKQINKLPYAAKATGEKVSDAQKGAVEVKTMGAGDAQEAQCPKQIGDTGISHGNLKQNLPDLPLAA